MWAAVPIVILTVAVMRHRPYPMMMVWTGLILTVCLAPIAIWLYDRALSAAARRRDTGDAGKRPSCTAVGTKPAVPLPQGDPRPMNDSSALAVGSNPAGRRRKWSIRRMLGVPVVA